MKKNFYFIFAALMLLTAACAQEELPVSGEESNTETSTENSGLVYIEAVSELTGETKSSVDSDDGDFKWSTGDKVAVYAAGGYQISEGLDASYNGMTGATFAFAGDFVQGDRVNFAVFPSDIVCDESGDVYTGEQVTAEGLLINLPATYNLSAVKGTMAPTPMIANNSSGQNLHFKSICALVKFTLHSIPKQTEYITFDFNGKKVRGAFVIENVVPGEEDTKVVATDTEEFDDVITVYNDNVFTSFQNDLIVNIPIPAGEYSKVTITTWDGDPWHGGHKINGITSSIRTAVADDGKSYLSWNAGRLSSGKREIFMPVFTVDGNISLGNGTKVVFAPGNLVADVATKAENKLDKNLGTGTNWRFAENQYDAVVNSEDNNGNLLGTVGKATDLFGWIGASATGKNDFTDDQKYGLIYPSKNIYERTEGQENRAVWDYWVGIDNTDVGYILSDWGTLSISGGKDITGAATAPYESGTWRLMDRNTGTTEWQRLITARKVTGNELLDYICTKAKIVNTDNTLVANGLIIFPDHYASTLSVEMPTLVKCDDYLSGQDKNGNDVYSPVANKVDSYYADNTITLDEWSALESQGCVFLPAAAYRQNLNTNNTGDGVYWTNYAAKSSNANAVALIFSDVTEGNGKSYLSKTGLETAKSFPRYYGASVRLVRQIN